jgi:hypothetical protein
MPENARERVCVHACAGILRPPAVCDARDLIRKRVNNERDVRHTMPNNDETLQLQITCSASLCHCAAAARDKNKPQHARHRPLVGRLELFARTHTTMCGIAVGAVAGRLVARSAHSNPHSSPQTWLRTSSAVCAVAR